MESDTDDLSKTPEQLAQEMKRLVGGSPTNPAFNTLIEMQALHKGACILIALSRKIEKQTRWVVGLTVALLVLTFALLLFALPSAIHEYHDAYRHHHDAAKTNHR